MTSSVDNPSFVFHLLSLFPDFFDTPLRETILGRARQKGIVEYRTTDIREFAEGKHQRTDDKPYGGGAGMVMKPGPIVRAIENVSDGSEEIPRVLLSPQGETFDQAVAEELSQHSGIILVCGRYEGVDERVRDGWIDREISIGDYVLSGGEPAALVVVDAITRLLPGVLGNTNSLDTESFSEEMLEYPQYTRPREFRGRSVPDVLLSGHHGKIEEWRHKKARERTAKRRPDLLKDFEEES